MSETDSHRFAKLMEVLEKWELRTSVRYALFSYLLFVPCYLASILLASVLYGILGSAVDFHMGMVFGSIGAVLSFVVLGGITVYHAIREIKEPSPQCRQPYIALMIIALGPLNMLCTAISMFL